MMEQPLHLKALHLMEVYMDDFIEQGTTTLPMEKLLPTTPELLAQLAPTSTIPDVTQPDVPALASSNRPSNERPSDERPQTPDVPSLSLKDNFDLQSTILDKMIQVCEGISNILNRYILASTRPRTNQYPCQTTPTCMKPATILHSSCLSLFPEPTPIRKPRPAPVCNNLIHNVHPIPAKPPYIPVCCHLAPIRLKDRMRPP